jgi:GNAT superfamily N-acetyltransferase
MTQAAEITIAPASFDGPVAGALVDELMADLTERYAADSVGDGNDPEVVNLWAVRTEQVTPPAGVFLVAWLDRVPVASGAVRPLPGGADGVGEVKRMYTAPEARRRGASRAILAELEALAKGFGYRRLQLETGSRQPEALALYAAAGWHEITPYGQYAGDTESVCFAKDL